MVMSPPSVLALCAAAFALVLTPVQAETFTIAVVSDTQNYTDVTLPQPRGVNTFTQQMRYLADTKAEKNLAFVTFVGDIVQHGDGRFRTGIVGQYTYWDTRTEWDYANLAVSILGEAGVPFGMVPGNHDYDNWSWYPGPNGLGANRPLSGGSVWSHYFGPSSPHFAGKTWYGGSYNNGMNSFQLFNAGGKRFLHLGLQMEPTPGDLKWAEQVLATYPDLPTIMTVHEWLAPNYTGAKDRTNGYKAYFDGAKNMPPDETWEKFVRKQPQIFMILAGHDFTTPIAGVSQGQNLRIDKNDAGHPVYQMVQDYQGNTVGPDGKPDTANGGAGWLRFIEFDTDAKKMRFYTYSTLLRRYAGRNGEATFGVPPSYSEFTLDFPPQLTK